MSDLLVDEWRGVRRSRPDCGGFVLHLLAPEELSPPMAGDLDLIDSETGSRLAVSMSEEAV